MDFNVIQITKINSIDFVFSDKTNITFPVAPLVSATTYQNQNVKTLKICSTLYINSQDSQNPVVSSCRQSESTDGQLKGPFAGFSRLGNSMFAGPREFRP